MSIFTPFIKLVQFLENLFTSVKKEYLNLEPEVKTDIDNVIKFGNIAKGYLANPGTAPLDAQVLISLAENEIGSAATTAITNVLGQSLVDLGAIDTAITDPISAAQALLNHLQPLTGNKFGDELFNAVKYIAMNLSNGNLVRSAAQIIIQFVYDTFFKANSTPTATPIAQTIAPITQAAADAANFQGAGNGVDQQLEVNNAAPTEAAPIAAIDTPAENTTEQAAPIAAAPSPAPGSDTANQSTDGEELVPHPVTGYMVPSNQA